MANHEEPSPVPHPLFDERAPRPVPPLDAQDGATFVRLVGVVKRLLGPGGCPWDREQTIRSTRKYVLEEACEVLDAIDQDDRGALREELGDLVLQVVFLSELARAEKAFGIDDAIASIVDKLVVRHPHVFGDVDATTSAEVRRNWDAIKAKEKAGRGLLEGVPKSLPALVRAQTIGDKVRRVGFDWPDAAGSRAKLTEELGELDHAMKQGDADAVKEELGDVMFALVNLARHLGIDAEEALQRTTEKFQTRFSHVEARVKEEHGGFEPSLPLEVLDRYWDEAKALRAATNTATVPSSPLVK